MGKKFYENEYVIWLEFDESMTAFLNERCKLLEQHNIEAGIRPPHLTMTFVRSDNEEELKNTVAGFLERVNKLSITLNSIGIFPGGVVFYEPKVTIELLQLHKEFCDALAEIAELSWDLYVPNCWTPHIALTGTLSDESLNTAITIMNDKFYGVKADKFIVKLKKCFKGKEIESYTIG